MLRRYGTVLFKLAFIAAATLAVLMTMARATWGQALLVGLVLTVVLYAAGDVVILPRLGNFAATVADGGATYVLARMAPAFTGMGPVTPVAALTLALVVALLEGYFHNMLRRNVPDSSGRPF